MKRITRRIGILLCVLLVFMMLSAGGDPYGGREPLWRLYFESDPAVGDSGTRDIPLGDQERCEATRELFSYVGANDVTSEPLGKAECDGCPGNVVAELPGEIPDAIIVSAHLDRSGTGQGAVDDFSGVVMLGMLYTYFMDRSHRHALVFVAFCGEEAGLTGSRHFIEESPRMPAAVTAVVNLECLGVLLPHSWAEGSSESLEEILTRAAMRRGVDSGPVSIIGVSADSVSFLSAGYPAITIEGIGPEHIRLLGTPWDHYSRVRGDIFDTTFAVLVDFINALDALRVAPSPSNGR